MSKDILDYICFFSLEEDIVIIGHNLYSHILYYFMLAILMVFVIHGLGLAFFLCYFLGWHSFFSYYLKSFKLYINFDEVDFFIIELPTDLIYRLLIFFLFLSFFFSWISVSLGQERFLIIFWISFSFFFFIPTFKYTHLLIGSYLFFEFGFVHIRVINVLNRGGLEPPTLPLSGVCSAY